MITTRLVEWLEVLGGSRPLPDSLGHRNDLAIVRAVWWVLLFLVALAFAGRNTKFVYVDF